MPTARTRDGQASRRRALDAAAAEFAAHGIAGARVDRIAAAAAVNKAQMYSYFGSKDGLFDAVFNEQLRAIVASVPLDAEDLPGYVVDLYDEYLAHPELVRLATWARLERVPTGDLLGHFEVGSADKLDAIAAAQAAGLIDGSLDPEDIYALVTAVSLTWSPASVLHTASAGEDESRHTRRREILAETVRRMFARGSASAPTAGI